MPDAGKMGFDGLARYHDGGRVVPSFATPPLATPSFTAPSFAAAPTSRQSDRPMTINLTVYSPVSREDTVDYLDAAAETEDGQTILVNAHKIAKRRGAIR